MSANTYVYCWEVVRTDAVAFRYTTHSSNIEFLGQTWTSVPSVEPTVIQKALGMSVNNLDFKGVFGESLDITLDDVRDGKFNSATLTGYRVDSNNLSDFKLEFKGTLGEFTWNDYFFQAEARSNTYLLGKSRSEVYSRTCPYVLGDSKCKVNTASFSSVFTITDVSGALVTVNNPVGVEYNLGRISYASGATQIVQSVSGSTVTLWEPPLAGVGDTVTLIQGCDKIRQTCKSKFNNIRNFGGFDLIPPEDILTDVAAPGKPGRFDGSSYYQQLA